MGVNVEAAVVRRGTNTEFDDAYRALSLADEAREGGHIGTAIELYTEAMSRYTAISNRYPKAAVELVKFRIAYCRNQIDALSLRSRAGQATEAPASASDSPSLFHDSRGARLSAIVSSAVELLVNNDPAAARVGLLRALSSAPDNAEVRMLIAVAQCQSGRFDDALHVLTSLTNEVPESAQISLLMAAAQFGLGMLPEARESLARALALDPNCMPAHYNMAQVLLRLDPPDVNGARSHYRQAIGLGAQRDPEMDRLLK